jgi:hypothetical protein
MTRWGGGQSLFVLLESDARAFYLRNSLSSTPLSVLLTLFIQMFEVQHLLSLRVVISVGRSPSASPTIQSR